MSSVKKLMMSAAGGGGLDIDEVFSTYVYTGTGSTRAISNGIDLNGEGGLVWIKSRDAASTHNLANTNSGAGKYLASNQTWSEVTNGNGINSFNSNGFSVGSEGDVNRNNEDFTSWSFRKAPKFFDVVTYTGNGHHLVLLVITYSLPGYVIIVTD